MTITEKLRKMVNESDESRYAIAKAAEIDQAGLSRFAHGGNVSGETIDKLAAYFGLELRPAGRSAKSTKRS